MTTEANESILLEPCTPPVVRATQASGLLQAPAAQMPDVRAATNVMWWVGEELRPLTVAETLAALPLAARVERSMKHAFDRSHAGAHGCVRFGKSISKLRAIRHQLAMLTQRATAPHAAQTAFARGAALPSSVDLARSLFAGAVA